MTAMLTPADRDRLLKMLRLMSSDQPGECAAAAAAATRLIREAGVEWDELIPNEPRPTPLPRPAYSASEFAASAVKPDVAWLMRRASLLSPWEQAFVSSVACRSRLSDKQRAKLAQMVADVTLRAARA